MKQSIKLFSLCLVVLLSVFATSTVLAQKKTKIRLERADLLKNLKLENLNIIRYLGNVHFFYDSTSVRCDSAYYNDEANQFDAYGNVVVQKGSSKIFGDKLHYDGKTSTGKLTGQEVKLIDEETMLITKEVNFNSKTNFVYYPVPGVITTKDSKLTSKKGYFDKNISLLAFSGDVVMDNPDGVIKTDSLTYNTKSEVASFFKNTRITNDDGFIYCNKGWHNRQLKQSSFQQDAYLINGAQRLFANNIFYDEPKGYARATDNVVVVDTTNNTYLFGQKANYWKNEEAAEVTDNPFFVAIDNKDTLFLRSDFMYLQSIKPKDTTKTDSTQHLIKAIGNVRFYRTDIQGLCDSLIYQTKDSTLYMYATPILWNDVNQITADLIKVLSANKKIHEMEFIGNAFITSHEDSIFYNQIRGKTIDAHFIDGKLNTMDILGNGQAIYYIRDNNVLTMVNRSEGSKIKVNIKENKVSKINVMQKPTSNLYPIDKVEYEDITLKGFKWLDNKRPKNKYSILENSKLLFPKPKVLPPPKTKEPDAKPTQKENNDKKLKIKSK
ncbi:MAG: hypothetical protein H6537_06570 [Bacteroidales bacterium]|nr:hypothetical protein [Bacteroidales bacterium]HRX31457.1 OstA-like protein [Tenuifilaceae bacterium]